MGGGDLNMKKHFHPLTMQNLERVWKAEQKAKDEAEKLEQLQRELAEERRRESLQQHAVEQGIAKKKAEKLDWMYAGPQVNHEEYLLGRKVDKNVDILKESEETKEGTPVASLTVADTIADPVKDMAAKIKEDPLFLIRKKEEESKKELVQNPIKLKKLKEMLNLSVGDKHKHKKSKKTKKSHTAGSPRRRKHKKEERYHKENGYDDLRKQISKGIHGDRFAGRITKRKSRRSKGSSIESELSDIEELRRKKSERRHKMQYSSEEEQKRETKGSRKRKSSFNGSCNENGVKNWHEKSDNRKHKRRKSVSSDETASESGTRYETKHSPAGSSKYGYASRHSAVVKNERRDVSYRDSNFYRRNHGDQDRDTNLKSEANCDSPHRKKRHSVKHNSNGNKKARSSSETESKFVSDYSKKSAQKDRRAQRQRSYSSSDPESRPYEDRKPHLTKNAPKMMANNISRKLKADDLEKRRLEMMDNAKWRDDQRKSNIKHYKIEAEKEERVRNEDLKNFDRESKVKFIHEMQMKSLSSSSTASVEDRIKRNIYTKQRTQAALNKKFTEK